MRTAFSTRHTRPMHFWLILAVTSIVLPFACEEEPTAPPGPPGREFEFPHAIGTQWFYTYSLLYRYPIEYEQEEVHGWHSWRVTSVSTDTSNTAALVAVSRIDTVHYTQNFAYFRQINTTYIRRQDTTFTITVSPTTIEANWLPMMTLTWWVSTGLTTIPRTYVRDTVILQHRDPTATAVYVDSLGLVSYAGDLVANHSINESLRLTEFRRK